MSYTVQQEADSHFVVHDGRGSFRVPKQGLSESMLERIRAHGRKMADGGITDGGVDAGMPQVTGPSVPVVGGGLPEMAGGANPLPSEPVVMPDTRAAPSILDNVSVPAALTTALSAGVVPAGILSGPSQLPPGVRPKSSVPSEPSPQPPPAPPAQRPSGGMGKLPADTSMGEFDKAQQMERQAIDESAAVATERAKAEAQALVEHGKVLKQAALDEAALRTRAKAQADQAMARVQAAQDEMARVNTKVDPGRYMASQSTAGKIATAIGLALGAFDPSGVNRAAQLLNQFIDRDVDAQKAETELSMRKAGAKVQGAQNLYAMQREATGDDLAAHAAAKASMYEVADLKLKEIAASAMAPAAKAKAMELSAALQAEKAKWMADAHKRLVDEHFRKDSSAQGWAALGLQQSKTPADKNLTEQRQRAVNMLSSLDKAEEIIKRSGTMELVGPDQQLLEKALTDFAIDSAKLKDPSSAAREGEVKTELEALGVKPGAVFTSNKTALDLIRKAKEDVRKRVSISEQVR